MSGLHSRLAAPLAAMRNYANLQFVVFVLGGSALGLVHHLHPSDRLADVAREHYAAMVAIDPDYVDGLVGLAEEEARAGEAPTALELLRIAAATGTRDGRVHLLRAQAAIALGHLDEARAAAETAIERGQGHNPLAHTTLGNALASLGRLAEAATHLEQALALEPDMAGADGVRRNLATLRQHMLKRQGQP